MIASGHDDATPSIDKSRGLFGADPTPGIVAVERAGDRQIRVYQRRDGVVSATLEPFEPWIMVSRSQPKVETRQLQQ